MRHNLPNGLDTRRFFLSVSQKTGEKCIVVSKQNNIKCELEIGDTKNQASTNIYISRNGYNKSQKMRHQNPKAHWNRKGHLPKVTQSIKKQENRKKDKSTEL